MNSVYSNTHIFHSSQIVCRDTVKVGGKCTHKGCHQTCHQTCQNIPQKSAQVLQNKCTAINLSLECLLNKRADHCSQSLFSDLHPLFNRVDNLKTKVVRMPFLILGQGFNESVTNIKVQKFSAKEHDRGFLHPTLHKHRIRQCMGFWGISITILPRTAH